MGPPGKDTLLQTVRSFLSSSGPHLVLDTRPRALFRAKHLSPSTNIPLDHLDNSWFQLPAKQTPFAVLESAPDPAATSPFVKHTSSTDLLKDHGWFPQWIFQDHPLFWSTMAEELSIRSHSADQTHSSNDCANDIHIQTSGSPPPTRPGSRYHFLFRPNPVLVKTLPLIEKELMQLRSTTNKSSKSKPLLRCLDVGCGSGRDMIYMVARSANGQAVQGAEWSALGMDQREDMCALVQQLARDTFLQDDGDLKSDHHNKNNNHHNNNLTEKTTLIVPDTTQGPGKDLVTRVSALVGKVHPTTGVFWITSPPSSLSPSSSSSSRFNAIETHSPWLRLHNLRYRDIITDQSHQQRLNEPHPAEAIDERFDLIVMIRFLQRSLFAPLVHHWLRPGGFLILSTFVSDTDLPHYTKPGPTHRLQSKTEAREIFEFLGLKVVMEEISLIEDGTRPVATVMAQKPI